MQVDLSLLVSAVAVFFALLSWLEARRMSRMTKIALRSQLYEKTETLPSIEPLSVVEVNGKARARLIIFNQRETPFRVHCVKCFRYEPKGIAWISKVFGPFSWDYIEERAMWNPKGNLDDDEHYSDESLKFTLVKDVEILMVTLPGYKKYSWEIYRIEVFTSHGSTSWRGVMPGDKCSLPIEHMRRIRTEI